MNDMPYMWHVVLVHDQNQNSKAPCFFFFWVKKCISILDVKQFYPHQPIKYLSFFSSFGVSFLRFDPEILIETLTYIKVKLIKKI